MPLYKINPNNHVEQIKPAPFSKERNLQKLFEANMEALFSIRFIASEFTTGDRQRGRIDTLGFDQNGYPTIIEYKRSSKENVINQGLFYLDWLIDHRGDFTLVAQEALNQDVNIDWSHPRLILVAESFSDYDKYAVNRIGANIELWTYRRYGENLLHLDPLFIASSQPTKGSTSRLSSDDESIDGGEEIPIYTLDDHKARKSQDIIDIFEQLRDAILTLGEEGEIVEKANKMYIGYSHGKNFAEIRIQSNGIKVWLDIPYIDLEDPLNLARDVQEIGHYGTGQVEINLTTLEKLKYVITLIKQSYQQTI